MKLANLFLPSTRFNNKASIIRWELVTHSLSLALQGRVGGDPGNEVELVTPGLGGIWGV